MKTEYEQWEAEGQRIQSEIDRVHDERFEAMNRTDPYEPDRLLDELHRLNELLEEHMEKMPPK